MSNKILGLVILAIAAAMSKAKAAAVSFIPIQDTVKDLYQALEVTPTIPIIEDILTIDEPIVGELFEEAHEGKTPIDIISEKYEDIIGVIPGVIPYTPPDPIVGKIFEEAMEGTTPIQIIVEKYQDVDLGVIPYIPPEPEPIVGTLFKEAMEGTTPIQIIVEKYPILKPIEEPLIEDISIPPPVKDYVTYPIIKLPEPEPKLIVSPDWSGPYSCLDPYIDEAYYDELRAYYGALDDITRQEAQEAIWAFISRQ